jgi:hypothetical protein
MKKGEEAKISADSIPFFFFFTYNEFGETRRTSMKVGIPVLFAMILLNALCIPLPAQETEPTATATLDWAQLETNWKNYQTAPGMETGRLVSDLLPTSGKISDVAPRAEAFRQMIDSQLNFLDERLLIENDPAAAVIAFRLLTISSGELEKKLELMLGRFMIFSPRLFLQELYNHRDAVVHLEVVLTSYKFDGSLNAESFDLERKHRIKLIEEINEKELKGIKKECLKILNSN